MNAGEARSIAERWVAEEVGRSRGEVLAAFTAGSINWMSDEAPFPAGSDVDVWLVVAQVDEARHRVVKHDCAGLAVESAWFARGRFRSPEAVLADFGLGPNLAHGRILHDPEGILEDLQRLVAADFAQRHWVRQRCRSVRDDGVRLIDAHATNQDLLYLNGVTFHGVRCLAQMVLTADLRNPTVKTALVRAREVLAAYGLDRELPGILRLFGAAELGDEAILAISTHCRQALDEARRWLRTPFVGDICVTVHAYPALDRDLPGCLAEGKGREMFLWIASLYAHALIALENDAPLDVAAAARHAYVADMAQLGAGNLANARAQMLACRPALERMLEVCDDLVARNPRATG